MRAHRWPVQLVPLEKELVLVTEDRIVAMDVKAKESRVTWKRK